MIVGAAVALVVAYKIHLSYAVISLFVFVTMKFIVDVHSMMCPTKFVDLSTDHATRKFMAVQDSPVDSWPLKQEVRPISDAALHVLMFQWQIFGTSSKVFGRILKALNASYDSWDIPFENLGKNAENEVLEYCKRYGISLNKWPWSKSASEYKTMNEWFGRSYRDGVLPSVPLHKSEIVTAPATAVVTIFESVKSMPRLVKNDRFSIQGVVPEYQMYMSFPCTLHYLSPADYHCFHAPISGKIISLDLLVDKKTPYSVTVKRYVFQYINILKRNRRAVLVIERKDGFRCAMVIIGGITVDSIRLEPGIKAKQQVTAGQKVGTFARGGSSIALFFSKPVRFCHTGRDSLSGSGIDFKLMCNATLCESL